MMLFLASSAKAQTQGCSTNGTDLTGDVQSYALCTPQLLDGRNKGGWIILHRAGDQSNNETQCYDPQHAFIANGFLTLLIDKRTQTCQYYPAQAGSTPFSGTYTSAYVQMFNFPITINSDVIIRMKGVGCLSGGCWPALWMLGTGCEFSSWITADNITYGGVQPFVPSGTCNWPTSGEIDIFEQQGSPAGSDTVLDSRCNTFASGGTHAATYTISDSSANFHLYELRWTASSVQFVYDGTVQSGCTFTTNIPPGPMFLNMNIAMVPSASGAGLPANMQIDYVKVCSPSPCNGNGGNTIFFDDFVPQIASSLARPLLNVAKAAASVPNPGTPGVGHGIVPIGFFPIEETLPK